MLVISMRSLGTSTIGRHAAIALCRYTEEISRTTVRIHKRADLFPLYHFLHFAKYNLFIEYDECAPRGSLPLILFIVRMLV